MKGRKRSNLRATLQMRNVRATKEKLHSEEGKKDLKTNKEVTASGCGVQVCNPNTQEAKVGES
jgi:hypothetical protein